MPIGICADWIHPKISVLAGSHLSSSAITYKIHQSVRLLFCTVGQGTCYCLCDFKCSITNWLSGWPGKQGRMGDEFLSPDPRWRSKGCQGDESQSPEPKWRKQGHRDDSRRAPSRLLFKRCFPFWSGIKTSIGKMQSWNLEIMIATTVLWLCSHLIHRWLHSFHVSLWRNF